MLYLLRHGDAEENHADGDAARRLTPKGEKQARAAGLALVAMEAKIDACLASPKVRAAETTRLTGGHVKLKKGGLAIVDGSTLAAPLRPRELAALAGGC